MSASWFSGELKASKRFELGELLSERTRHFLLMTATPHNGRRRRFSDLPLAARTATASPVRVDRRAQTGVADGLMRRMVKEKLVTFEGRPLFRSVSRRPPPIGYRQRAVPLRGSHRVTSATGMNLADRWRASARTPWDSRSRSCSGVSPEPGGNLPVPAPAARTGSSELARICLTMSSPLRAMPGLAARRRRWLLRHR